MIKIALLIILTMVSATALADDFVTLKSGTRVESNSVTLGDLFDNAGERADDRVASSPAPGSTMIYTSNWLTNIAASHGLRWQPPSPYASIRVERASVTVGPDQIAEAIGKFLDIDGVSERVLLDSQTRLHAATNVPTDIGIEHLSVNRENDHFLAEIRVPANDPAAVPVRISGTVQKFVQTPATIRSVMPGELIRANDLVLIWQKAEFNPTSAIPSLSDLIGKTPRHPLRINQPLRVADIETPLIVKRNDNVLIILEQPGMVLTAEGKALDNGGLGELIRVMNVQSNRAIDATVVASGRVSVHPPTSIAAAY